MAVGPADTAEMTLMQRMALVCPPLHNWHCRCGGCEGVSCRKCNTMAFHHKVTKKEEKNKEDIHVTIIAHIF